MEEKLLFMLIVDKSRMNALDKCIPNMMFLPIKRDCAVKLYNSIVESYLDKVTNIPRPEGHKIE